MAVGTRRVIRRVIKMIKEGKCPLRKEFCLKEECMLYDDGNNCCCLARIPAELKRIRQLLEFDNEREDRSENKRY